MNKKLTAKIQKLIPTLGESEVSISSCIAIEPPEKELILKKGFVYSVFDIKSPGVLNVSLVGKLINDVLYESYYNTDSISPIQSLEKSIMNINEKITGLYTGENKQYAKIEINMITAVLWGNVLYLVQYGKGSGFLMREGNITPVKYTSEGNFSVSSGMIKPDDVVILNTEEFSKKFPPQKLLDASLSPTEMAPGQSCFIIKFIVDTDFTQEEMIDFDLPAEKKTSKIAGIFENIKNKIPKRVKKEKPIESLVDMGEVTAPVNNFKEKTNIKIKTPRNSKIKINSKFALIFAALILIGSISTTIILRSRSGQDNTSKPKSTSQLTQPSTQVKDQTQPKDETKPDPEVLKAEDEQNKVVRVQPTIFYDLKLADQNANPNEISLFKDMVAVTDLSLGKIFTSPYETPKFTATENTFPGIKQASNFDGDLVFSDNQGYKRFDLTKNSISESFDGTFDLFDTYIGNIYSVENNKIIKNVKSGTTLTSSVWAESESFSKVKSLVVAYNIYLLTSDGNLDVYTQGEKSIFQLTDLDKPLLSPVKVATDVNFDNIYIADSGNKRVVVVTTAGKFVKQYKTENEDDWADIKSVAITDDESKMYVLSSSRVFEVSL